RGVDAHGGARHPGGHPQLRRGPDAADYVPDEGALALAVRPRVEVVRNEDRGEPRPLRLPGVCNQVGRSVLLAGEEDADLGQEGTPASDSWDRPSRAVNSERK